MNVFSVVMDGLQDIYVWFHNALWQEGGMGQEVAVERPGEERVVKI